MEDSIHIGVDEPFDLGYLLPERLRQAQVFRSLHCRIILREYLALQMQHELFQMRYINKSVQF